MCPYEKCGFWWFSIFPWKIKLLCSSDQLPTNGSKACVSCFLSGTCSWSHWESSWVMAHSVGVIGSDSLKTSRALLCSYRPENMKNSPCVFRGIRCSLIVWASVGPGCCLILGRALCTNDCPITELKLQEGRSNVPQEPKRRHEKEQQASTFEG